jgi:hypothetical protein
MNVLQPSLGLRPYVRFYAHTEVHCATQPFIQPVPARSAQVIEFALDDRYEVTFPDSSRSAAGDRVTVVGVQTHRRLFLTMRGHVESFVIVFQPAGLFALFGIPANLLADQHFEAANSGRRGARPARREERAYQVYGSDEQRSPAGCIGGQNGASYFRTGP